MECIYSKEDILKILPHRAPFLFIDNVVVFSENQKIVCNYTIPKDAFWVDAHFPGHPIMPGVLLVEMMAQAGGIMICASNKEYHNTILLNVKDVRFRNNAVPGDDVEVECTLVSQSGNIAEFECNVHIGTKKLADANIVLMFN